MLVGGCAAPSTGFGTCWRSRGIGSFCRRWRRAAAGAVGGVAVAAVVGGARQFVFAWGWCSASVLAAGGLGIASGWGCLASGSLSPSALAARGRCPCGSLALCGMELMLAADFDVAGPLFVVGVAPIRRGAGGHHRSRLPAGAGAGVGAALAAGSGDGRLLAIAEEWRLPAVLWQAGSTWRWKGGGAWGRCWSLTDAVWGSAGCGCYRRAGAGFVCGGRGFGGDRGSRRPRPRSLNVCM